MTFGAAVDHCLQRAFSWFQRAFNFLWNIEDTFSHEEFCRRIKNEAEIRSISYEAMTVAYVENLEQKSAALLTHISIMIAVSGAYLSFSSNFAVKIFLAIEIIGYLWAALCALRCLSSNINKAMAQF